MRILVSRVYGAVVELRNRAFDSGLFRKHRAPVPVISVGNITAGGSGKTPVVEQIIRLAVTREWNPAVVTRGYRRESKGLVVVSNGKGDFSGTRESGDEAMQIARKFPSVPVIASKKRIHGARHAASECAARIVILDDAFQHRAIARDFNIVVFDASEAETEHRMLPAGRLREPLRNLARADVILLSRCSENIDCSLVERMLHEHTDAPVFSTRFGVRGLRSVGSDDVQAPDTLQGKDVFAFCGIGTPSAFEQTLRDLGMTVRELAAFRDHHWYDASDLQRVNRRAGDLGIEHVLTTEKDAVRIAALDAGSDCSGIFYPELQLEFLDGEEEFIAMLEKAVSAGS